MTPDKEHAPALMQQAADEAAHGDLYDAWMLERGISTERAGMKATIATLTAQLAAAEAKVAVAAEALKPFADIVAGGFGSSHGPEVELSVMWREYQTGGRMLPVGDFRQACAALRILTQEPSNAE